uniref:Thioredoxin domain-containing protein n=1 Tax=Globodera rostochiensis TaxID=31243 RepID=A0A914HHT3_GLORO
MLKVIDNKQQFEAFISPIEGGSKSAKFVHFCAPWTASCAQLDDLLLELQKEHGQNTFEVAKVDAESLPELSMEQKVSAVPTVIIFKNGNVAGRVEGFHPAELKDWAVKCSFDAISQNGSGPLPPVESDASSEAVCEDLNSRLKRLINSARLTLFMKGSPDAPRCGFSRQIVELLRDRNVDFWTFDILEDEQVRQGLKDYSDWPTYPQVYLDGELLGGLDVIREELGEQTFVDKLPKKQ